MRAHLHRTQPPRLVGHGVRNAAHERGHSRVLDVLVGMLLGAFIATVGIARLIYVNASTGPSNPVPALAPAVDFRETYPPLPAPNPPAPGLLI